LTTRQRAMHHTPERSVHTSVSLFQQTQLLGARDCLGTPLNVKLAVDVPGMGLDRVQGNEQLFADLLVGAALGYQAQYRQFSGGKRLGRFRTVMQLLL